MQVVRSARRALVALSAVALVAALAPAASAAAQRGVVHVVTAPERVLPAAGLPDLPPADFSDEVWFRLDGRGWTVRRTSRDGYIDQVASPRGITTFFSETGARDFTPASRLRKGYLREPWANGVIIDPMAAVERGELRLVGETVVDGEPAYELAADGPGRALNQRFFAAKDDGALLRWQGQIYSGLYTGDDTQVRNFPLRTFVIDVTTYERLTATAARAALRQVKAHRGRR